MRHLILLLSMISVFMSTAYLPLKQMYTPSKELTESEKAGLLLMREEEKLAFEVYTTMYKKWDHHVFYNILQSEERHGSMVKDLIVKYKLQDPYSEEFGKYTSPQLQQQYNNLITKGNGSLTDAFTAGAMIEDMDVSDLDRLLAETKNPDLLEVYGYLNHGSENHLRAFNRQLERSENAYTPSYISKERFDAIILENKEGGNCTSGKTNCHSGNKKCCSNKNNKACAAQDSKKVCNESKNTSCKENQSGQKKCCK